MLDDPIKYGLLAALAIALLVAAFTDLRHRRIGNWLTAAIAVVAPAFWWASGLSLWPEVALQIGVALGTFAVLAVLFALRAMGVREVSPQEAPELHAMIDRLCVQADLPKPKVGIMHS